MNYTIYDPTKAKTFQEFTDLVKGDELLCVNKTTGQTYTEGKKYTVVSTKTGLALEDNWGENSTCTITYSKFVKVTKPEPTQTTYVDTVSAFDTQVGGSHYNELGIQPLERTLRNKGYEAFVGACYTKIDKYTSRKKENEVEQLKKARHVLDMWIEVAEKQGSK